GGGYGVEIEAVGSDLPRVFAGIDGVLRVTQSGDGQYRLVAARDIRAELGAAIVASGGALMRLDHVEPASIPSTAIISRSNLPRPKLSRQNMARRSGSVWTGCGTVFMKEFADHL